VLSGGLERGGRYRGGHCFVVLGALTSCSGVFRRIMSRWGGVERKGCTQVGPYVRRSIPIPRSRADSR
jgi:hypothetical protein